MDIIAQEQAKEAKVKILQAFDRYRQAQQGQPVRLIYDNFARSYNNRELDIDPELYNQVTHVSRASIYFWQQGKHLGLQWSQGRKFNSFNVAQNPEALNLVLSLIKQNPEIKPMQLYLHIEKSFPGLTSHGAVGRFLRRLRETSKESIELRRSINKI